MKRTPTVEDINSCWNIFLDSSAHDVLKAVLEKTIINELSSFEHIKADKFEEQKAKVAGLRMALGHINMPIEKVMASLYPQNK